LRLRKSDRSIINVRLESVQLIQKDTDQTVLLTLSDITDRVRAEENLAQNLAQKSNDLDKLKLAYETIAKDQEKIRRSEEKYRETSQYLEKLINYANAPIIVWDPGFRIIRFNHAFERLTGRSSDSVIGQQLSLLFPENKREELMNFIRGTLTGSQWEAVEIPIQDTNGHVKIVLWNSATLFCEDGKTVLSVIAQGQDITERKRVEADLKKSEADIKEALAEKEVLLSEIHHRVKNNLTAFISLLSLDGSYEDSDSGRALRKDLQNRARSMALIHETLYKTGKFSNVDMEIYLKNLVGQIAQSYGSRAVINVVVEVNGTLKIDQATTAGLIINELVTNSFKYAFPPGFDCMAVRGAPCTIRVSLANEDGTDVLRVSDNGCGFHKGFDPLSSKSLGLKLVNFLAHHQLRADISIQRDKGIEFIFRLKNTRNEAK